MGGRPGLRGLVGCTPVDPEHHVILGFAPAMDQYVGASHVAATSAYIFSIYDKGQSLQACVLIQLENILKTNHKTKQQCLNSCNFYIFSLRVHVLLKKSF